MLLSLKVCHGFNNDNSESAFIQNWENTTYSVCRVCTHAGQWVFIAKMIAILA